MASEQRGTASLLVAAMCGVMLLLGLTAAFLTATAAAHRRAQSGADLAALAGATALRRGLDACGKAAEVAEANGSAVTECLVEDEDVTVQVQVDGPVLFGHSGTIIGRSRAGPG